ncbi:MAG: ribonuclease Y [Candidatus Zophobacter franzmannii]|nr:ribonuclease Y [Candidatus Zophobacter franzmannii]
MSSIIYILIGLVVGLIISGIFFLVLKQKSKAIIFTANDQAANIIEEAQHEIVSVRKSTILEAKEEWYKTKKVYEEEIKDRQKELRTQENTYNERVTKLEKRIESLDKKESLLQKQEANLKQKEVAVEKRDFELNEILKNQEQKLIEIAGMTREEATEILKNDLKESVRKQVSGEVRQMITQIKADANKKTAEILSLSIQRMAVDHVSESTVAVVSLPGDEMKGRIIGREGRNIRAFEKASGVDLIIDDTPEAVVLSCFDPVRREIARQSLERLIVDGRIHPGRIEEVIEKTAKEMDESLMKIGEKAFLEANIHNLSPNIIKLLGRLHYRTSYGQNILQHSIEAAWMCGIMAAELGLDQEIARRAALLHDIGKAVDHEFEGSHAAIGANIARKNGESKIIINAIEAHHEDVEPISVYAPLVQACDAISGARPGARREMLESYMQRLEKLEEIANSVEGLTKTYAIQAGRELRIIVEPASVDDTQTPFIANDIASKIEKEVQYPGQIKVTVIRETRQVAVAK